MKRLALILSTLSSLTVLALPPALPIGIIEDDAGRYYSVEIAATPTQRELGLMYRIWLAPWQGMLFVFPYPQPAAFWMKNTLIPLDMRFFNQYGQLIAHYPYATPCITKDCPTYPAPQGLTTYVLETRPYAQPLDNIHRIHLPSSIKIK